MGYSTVACILDYGQWLTFLPPPQSTDSVITAESHLIGCACFSTWQTPQLFHCTAAILPHKINSRSHYKDFRFDLSRCYHSSVILLFYCSSKNKKLISSNRPFKNNIVRYFVYFCSGSKNSSVTKLQTTELEHRKEERYKQWNIPVLLARSTNQISGLELIAA